MLYGYRTLLNDKTKETANSKHKIKENRNSAVFDMSAKTIQFACVHDYKAFKASNRLKFVSIQTFTRTIVTVLLLTYSNFSPSSVVAIFLTFPCT